MPQLLPAAMAPSLIRFAVVGAANTTTDFLVFAALFELARLDLLAANSLAYAAGTVQSYALNKTWTFRDRTRGRAAGWQFARFAAVNLAALGLSNAIVWTAAQVMPVLLAKAVAIVTVFFWNYGLSRRLVFRTR